MDVPDHHRTTRPAEPDDLDDPGEAIAETIAGLRLGRWDEARPRLRPRLVPSGRAGPLARPVAGGDRGWYWDLGLDVTGGIVRVDRRLWRAWGRSAETLWTRARTNLVDRPPPALALLVPPTIAAGPGGVGGGAQRPARSGPLGSTDRADPIGPLAVLVGDDWLTGWLLEPHALPDGPWSGGRAVVVSDRLVVLAGPGPGGRIDGERLGLLVASARTLDRADFLPFPIPLASEEPFATPSHLE